MTKQKHKKRLVRARMEKTGESHQTAQRVISEAAAGPTTDPAPPIPASATLLVAYLGHTFAMSDKPFTVGRNADCSLRVDDALASRLHLILRIVDGRLEVEDNGTANGTSVNGKRIDRRAAVQAGDVVRIGSSDLYVIGEEDVSSIAEAKVGAILAGRYRIRRVVPFVPGTLAGAGRGETQTVTYEADHVLLGGVCNIKLLRRGAEPHLRAWLLREGRALERASHPQVLKVFDIGETDAAEVYLVLERAPVATLDLHLDKARLDERGTLSIVRQLARILEHMHEKGVVHRGLRSGAVHVEERGDDVSVKLASFGYASLAGDPRLAARGSVYGHAAWMSPEQARGDEVDARTDLYALGILLYAMLAYRLPFASEDRDALLVMQREAPVPPLRGPGEAPSALDAICMKLLAKDRDERYANATALLAALPP
jgi:Protein kinase domain/FHA domain